MPANTGISPRPSPVFRVEYVTGRETDVLGPYALSTDDANNYAFNSIVTRNGSNQITLTADDDDTLGVIEMIYDANNLPIGANQSYRPAGKGGYATVRPWRAIQCMIVAEGGTGDKVETTDLFGTVLQSLFGGPGYANATSNVIPVAQESVVLDRATASATDTGAQNMRILGLADIVGNNFPQGVNDGYRAWKIYPIAAHIQEP